jgi:hypothetical protein
MSRVSLYIPSWPCLTFNRSRLRDRPVVGILMQRAGVLLAMPFTRCFGWGCCVVKIEMGLRMLHVMRSVSIIT